MKQSKSPTSLLLSTISSSNRIDGFRNPASQIWDALPRYRDHRLFRPCRWWEFSERMFESVVKILRERSGYEITFSNSGGLAIHELQTKLSRLLLLWQISPAGNKVGWQTRCRMMLIFCQHYWFMLKWSELRWFWGVCVCVSLQPSASINCW